MFHRKQAASIVLALLLMLSGCTPAEPAPPNTYISTFSKIAQEAFSPPDVFAQQAPHGEDYEIQWADPQMEARVRSLLDRPTGAIRHSDVWDIQSLTLSGGTHITAYQGLPQDTELAKPTSKLDETCRIEGEIPADAPKLESLEDLRHFDSLCVLRYTVPVSGPYLTQLPDLSDCEDLRSLELAVQDTADLSPLAGMDQVASLKLQVMGDTVPDLTPLTQMESLRYLWLDAPRVDLSGLAGSGITQLQLRASEILSLELLTQMPQLNALRLDGTPAVPSYEPLARTAIQYLDLGRDVAGRGQYTELDYTPISQMPELLFLDMSNHSGLELSVYQMLLDDTPKLRYCSFNFCLPNRQSKQLDGSRMEIYLDATP